MPESEKYLSPEDVGFTAHESAEHGGFARMEDSPNLVEVVEAPEAPAVTHEKLWCFIHDCQRTAVEMHQLRLTEDKERILRPMRRSREERPSLKSHDPRKHPQELVVPSLNVPSSESERWDNVRLVLDYTAQEAQRSESDAVTMLAGVLRKNFTDFDVPAGLEASRTYLRGKLGRDMGHGDDWRASFRLVQALSEAGLALRSPQLRGMWGDSLRKVAASIPLNQAKPSSRYLIPSLRELALERVDLVSPRPLPALPPRTGHGFSRRRRGGKALRKIRG